MQPDTWIRCCVAAQVFKSSLGPTLVSAEVQCWNQDGVLVALCKIADLVEVEVPDEATMQTAENVAAIYSRVLARVTDEVLYDRITQGQLHFLDQIPEHKPIAPRQ